MPLKINPFISKFAPVVLLIITVGAPRVLCQALTSVPSLDELAGNWQIASNLLSLPALNNSLGSGKAARDALAIGDLSFPPITLTSNTGSLLIDGQSPVLDLARW